MKNQAFIRRLGFALNGIKTAFHNESSFRFQCMAGFAALMVAAFFHAPPFWWVLFLIVIGAVLSAELINTSLESLMDRIHPEKHPSIQVAKDCAAGAVLIFSLISVIVFLFFLYDRLSQSPSI